MNGIGSDPLSSFVQPGHASSHPLVPTAGPGCPTPASASSASSKTSGPDGKKPRRRGRESTRKRRCISTACVACRKRKSKCDGAVPSCAACASVYGTECIYDPNSDHRRKGVYREKVDSMKAGSSTLQILIEAILNATEEQAFTIVKKIRTCDSLDTVAEEILRQEDQDEEDEEGREAGYESLGSLTVEGERDLARKMGELRVENGSVRYIGGTSHLIYHGGSYVGINDEQNGDDFAPGTDPITTWTRVTDDAQLITFLINKYFHYHYPYFTTLSKKLFLRDFLKGTAGLERTSTVYCSSLLVNAMLALGCHFTDIPEAYGTPGDNRTKGDGFFAEAKRLIIENGEYEKPRLVTVQALALMSVREAGCAREDKGWVYSGMSFRMAQDIGLNFEVGVTDKDGLDEHEIDARRITFWGCFLFDKCWSNYLGRLPLLPRNSFNIPLIDVFPDEDAELWKPFPDSGPDNTSAQPSRTRAIALQMSKLCEISSDLLIFFYHPDHIGRSSSKAAELKKLSELHKRLEEWHQELPKEFEPKEGQLPNVILMLMFFHLQYIHLFRPFLKYTPTASPLPAHVSPRRICTANAGAISKLMRLYKKTWNLRQICNIAVYMTHSACTIHLLNLPERTARRDIIHGVRHLEEIAEDWLCARRTLSILSVLARKWKCELPEDAALVLQRTDSKYGSYSLSTVPSPGSQPTASPASDGARQEQSQREISPLTQLTQAHMATKPSSRPIADATMSMYASVPGIDPGPYPSPMDFRGANNVDIGTLQPSHQRTPSYTQTFSPTDAGRFGSSQVVQPGPRLDTSEWFLSDSARWQQSFESWNNAGAGPGQQQQQVFMFGSAGDGGGATSSGAPLSPATAAAMRQHQSSGQQRQQRLQDEDEQLPDFHGLGASGWLAGLD